METGLNWYAVKVFWRRLEPLRKTLESQGIEYYAQTVLPSYVFVHTDRASVIKLRADCFGSLYVYSDVKTKEPLIVPDKELEIFRIVTSAGDTGLEFLDDDPARYRKGDLVRVTGGPFKGAEGYVVRIRKDRRLVVTVSGVAAIATSFIPPSLLEKVEG